MSSWNRGNTKPINIKEPEFSSNQVIGYQVLPSGRPVRLPLHRPLRIGSSHNCDVIISDPYVSSWHCTLKDRTTNTPDGQTLPEKDGSLQIQDNRSTNGTLVDGTLIDSARLYPGSVITIGRTSVMALGYAQLHQPAPLDTLVGNHSSMLSVKHLIDRTSKADCNVLIVGETGTGKELVAQAIHNLSQRKNAPLVALNCGAIPEQLIGSELFGHKQGSFTGATKNHNGVFAQANTGTLFLDEIGELPLSQQPHLLRVLETGKYRPVGGGGEEHANVRVIAATNKLNLADTQSHTLRPDLYHRLATVTIALPPLRSRPSDIPLLIQHFISELAPKYGTRTVSDKTMAKLRCLPWPGNVRELRAAVVRAYTLCRTELTIDSFIGSTKENTPPYGMFLSITESTGSYYLEPRALSPIDMHIRDRMLKELLRQGSIRSAAEALGMPKSTFSDKAKRFGICKKVL